MIFSVQKCCLHILVNELIRIVQFSLTVTKTKYLQVKIANKTKGLVSIALAEPEIRPDKITWGHCLNLRAGL